LHLIDGLREVCITRRTCGRASTREAEIQAALGDMNLEDMLDMEDAPRAAGADRQVRTGMVISVHGDDVFVEFGPKSQGVCPLTQFDAPPQSGARLEFVVERFDPR
jgi:hypothetical protein